MKHRLIIFFTSLACSEGFLGVGLHAASFVYSNVLLCKCSYPESCKTLYMVNKQECHRFTVLRIYGTLPVSQQCELSA